jgi:hypothetical protein
VRKSSHFLTTVVSRRAQLAATRDALRYRRASAIGSRHGRRDAEAELPVVFSRTRAFLPTLPRR